MSASATPNVPKSPSHLKGFTSSQDFSILICSVSVFKNIRIIFDSLTCYLRRIQKIHSHMQEEECESGCSETVRNCPGCKMTTIMTSIINKSESTGNTSPFILEINSSWVSFLSIEPLSCNKQCFCQVETYRSNCIFLCAECDYDSSNRDSVTVGGFGTTEEMCLAFLQYYPAVNFAACLSLPHFERVFSLFGITDVWLDPYAIFLSCPILTFVSHSILDYTNE